MRLHLTVSDTPELERALLGSDDPKDRFTGSVRDEVEPNLFVGFSPTIELAECELAGAVITGIISFPFALAGGLVANWLWAKLATAKGRVIIIEGEKIMLESEEQLTEVINGKITQREP